MRKSLKTLKKAIVIVLIFVLCASMVISTVAIAFGEENKVISTANELEKIYDNLNNNIVVDKSAIYDLWLEFSNQFTNRTGGTQEEKLAAEYLKTQFIEIGLSTYNGDYFQLFNQYIENGDGTGSLQDSQNVVGVQKSKTGNGKQVVIGAHYDNSHDLTGEAHSQGAYDNASGVATVLTMAKVLKDFDLGFDVVYVLFGMEEIGLFGSSAFVNKLSEVDKNNTLLMMNFDSTICGDYLYAYSDELERLHENIFFESDKALNLNSLRKFPSDKKSQIVSMEDSFSIHVGQRSDNYPFLKAGINSISFSGYNLESKEMVGGIEKEGSNDIMHTSNDNVEKILKLYGEDFVSKRLVDVTSIALTTIIRSDFADVMVQSFNENPVPTFINKKWFIGTVYGVCVGVFILAIFLILNKLKKEKPEPIPEQKVEVTKEDIFKFVDEMKKSSGTNGVKPKDDNDDDDIFGLK